VGIVPLTAIYALIKRVWKAFAIQIISSTLRHFAELADSGKLCGSQKSFKGAGLASYFDLRGYKLRGPCMVPKKRGDEIPHATRYMIRTITTKLLLGEPHFFRDRRTRK